MFFPIFLGILKVDKICFKLTETLIPFSSSLFSKINACSTFVIHLLVQYIVVHYTLFIVFRLQKHHVYMYNLFLFFLFLLIGFFLSLIVLKVSIHLHSTCLILPSMLTQSVVKLDCVLSIEVGQDFRNQINLTLSVYMCVCLCECWGEWKRWKRWGIRER